MNTTCAVSVAIEEEGALIFSAVKNPSRQRRHRPHVQEPDPRSRGLVGRLSGLARRCAHRRAGVAGAGKEVGWDTLEGYAESWFDYSAKMVEAIRRLKSGRLVIHTTHDPFPGVPDGIPVKVDVEVDTQAAIIVVDLTDNPDCQPCGLNLTESTSNRAARSASNRLVRE